jgi:hypothetical protein
MFTSKIFAAILVVTVCLIGTVYGEVECSVPVEGLCYDFWNHDWKLEACYLVDQGPISCNNTFDTILCNASKVHGAHERSARALRDIGDYDTNKCAFTENVRHNGSDVEGVFNVTIVCGKEKLQKCPSVKMESMIIGIMFGVLICIFFVIIFCLYICHPVVGKRNVIYAYDV